MSTSENVTSANYEQWYKQTVRSQSDSNSTFSEIHASPKQRHPESQNVENFENIQQSTEFVNLEVVTPEVQKRDIYGSRDSINKETLDNDQQQMPRLKEPVTRDFRQEVNNVEVPTVQQPLQAEQVIDLFFEK